MAGAWRSQHTTSRARHGEPVAPYVRPGHPRRGFVTAPRPARAVGALCDLRLCRISHSRFAGLGRATHSAAHRDTGLHDLASDTCATVAGRGGAGQPPARRAPVVNTFDGGSRRGLPDAILLARA